MKAVRWKVERGSALLDCGSVVAEEERDVMNRVLAGELGAFAKADGLSYRVTAGGLVASVYGDEFKRVAGSHALDEKNVDALKGCGHLFDDDPFAKKLKAAAEAKRLADGDVLREAMRDLTRVNAHIFGETTLGVRPAGELVDEFLDYSLGSELSKSRKRQEFARQLEGSQLGDTVLVDGEVHHIVQISHSPERGYREWKLVPASAPNSVGKKFRVPIGRGTPYASRFGNGGPNYGGSSVGFTPIAGCPHSGFRETRLESSQASRFICPTCGASAVVADIELGMTTDHPHELIRRMLR